MAKRNELKQYFAQCIAECFSTFMLILIGEGAIAQYKFTGTTAQSPIIINICFGIGVYTGTTNLENPLKYLRKSTRNCVNMVCFSFYKYHAKVVFSTLPFIKDIHNF